MLREQGELVTPTGIVFLSCPTTHDEQVNVVGGVPITASSGPEQRRVSRLNLPCADRVSQATLKLEAEPGKDLHGRLSNDQASHSDSSFSAPGIT